MGSKHTGSEHSLNCKHNRENIFLKILVPGHRYSISRLKVNQLRVIKVTVANFEYNQIEEL